MWIDIIAMVLAFVALLVALLSLLREERASRRELAFPLVLDFIEEFRSDNFKELVELCLTPTPPTREVRVDGHVHLALQRDYQNRIRPVLEYFDNVGVLVADGVMSPERVFSLMGATAVRVWRAQAPYIVARRERRATGRARSMLYAHYEHLAVQLDRLSGADLRSRLRLERAGVECHVVPTTPTA